MPNLSEEKLETFAAQVDAELFALHAKTRSFGMGETKGGPRISRKSHNLPAAPKQRAAIEKASGESLESFWQRFLDKARDDLCKPGGMMHDAWQKYRELDSKTAVKSVHGILFGMGFAEHSVLLMIVPVAVFMLTVLLNIGKETICEECGKD